MNLENEQKSTDNQSKDKPFPAKCEACGKEGWTGRQGYPEGNVLNRMFMTFSGKTLCDKCCN